MRANRLTDGIIWVDGMNITIVIDSKTPDDDLPPAHSIGDNITIVYTTCPLKIEDFWIVVNRVERPANSTAGDSLAAPPALNCNSNLQSDKNTALILGGACAVSAIFTALMVFRYRKLIVIGKVVRNGNLNDALIAIEDESGEFSSKFFNEFLVTKIRGIGGYGCVFEVVNKYDNWEYAVKRIAVDIKDIETALREVRAMAQFDHHNIVRYNSTWVERPPEGWQNEADDELLKTLGSSGKLMNFMSDSMFIYIQMQLCNHSLSDWLRDNQEESSRNIPRMKAWFKQIVSAVEYIHKRNLIHRDLKPSNILFAEADLLKLCDMGIATERRYDEETDTTLTRTSIGTLLYMSPEQRLLFRYSSKSDVFTLGLILVELCVVMTVTERSEIFNNFRRGDNFQCINDEKTVEFISKITQLEPKNRPTCSEMLDHLFLA